MSAMLPPCQWVLQESALKQGVQDPGCRSAVVEAHGVKLTMLAAVVQLPFFPEPGCAVLGEGQRHRHQQQSSGGRMMDLAAVAAVHVHRHRTTVVSARLLLLVGGPQEMNPTQVPQAHNVAPDELPLLVRVRRHARGSLVVACVTL